MLRLRRFVESTTFYSSAKKSVNLFSPWHLRSLWLLTSSTWTLSLFSLKMAQMSTLMTEWAWSNMSWCSYDRVNLEQYVMVFRFSSQMAWLLIADHSSVVSKYIPSVFRICQMPSVICRVGLQPSWVRPNTATLMLWSSCSKPGHISLQRMMWAMWGIH